MFRKIYLHFFNKLVKQVEASIANDLAEATKDLFNNKSKDKDSHEMKLGRR